MSSPKFAETHNVVAFLEKPKESDGFAEIIDFLKASSIYYALTVNPVIYTSCIEQFWATAKVQTVNGVRQLQALVDKKRVIVTESSIRRDLHLDDAEGTDCLPTATIFEELARMGYEKPSQKLTFYKAFFSPQWKYFIHTITQCLSAKSTAWNEFSSFMASLIICLATNQKFNLSKYIFDAMVKHLDGGVKFLMYPCFLQVFINQQLVNETQERHDEDLMFDTGVLDGDEMFVDATTGEKDEQSTKIDDSTAGEAVTTAGVEDSAVPIIPTTVEETLAQTFMKSGSPHHLDAKIIEEERLERKKQEEANIALIESWENTQAMMEADRLLAERLQTREREELTDEEKGKLFMELMEKRRKHFAALRAQEKRNRPPTKAQKRSQMSTYLKHMGGYKHKQLMGKSYDEIQKLFDKEMKRVNTFVAMSSEAQESNEKEEMVVRLRKLKANTAERGLDKEMMSKKEVEADDTAELKKHLVIKKDDDIAIDAIPLATKPPVIVEYKLVKEGIMVHYQLIRADGSSKRYSSMIRML
ncbi:hypothetical protein Tco_1371615 [Tanacetum coccineum]